VIERNGWRKNKFERSWLKRGGHRSNHHRTDPGRRRRQPFRGEFLQTLRRICDEGEALLIFDEVQSGMGITGNNWCCEHFGVLPDLLTFGKKAQVCGVMAGPRLDEVKDNCFRLPSRISSTWGGNFTDYVRSTHYLRIIENEDLVQNARRQGEYFLSELQTLAVRHPVLSAVRGRGLMLAFDCRIAPCGTRFGREHTNWDCSSCVAENARFVCDRSWM